ncbi:Uma2 family endonuclease [Dyadobacter sp.]|uniref:Uma2 family endonuclease n=1 Tax=Dyadobacter sp. TaxID=1914288 RepID=UPI003F6F282A
MYSIWNLYNPDLTQIINGEVVLSRSPKVFESKIATELLWILMEHVQKNDLGKVFKIPLDTILEEEFNVLQPDLLFVSNEQAHIMRDWIHGAPDMVVELVSPDTRNLDTIIKKEIYERYGVKEYWLIFPEEELIEVHTLHLGQYQLHGKFTADQQVRTPVFPTLDFDANAIFTF